MLQEVIFGLVPPLSDLYMPVLCVELMPAGTVLPVDRCCCWVCESQDGDCGLQMAAAFQVQGPDWLVCCILEAWFDSGSGRRVLSMGEASTPGRAS